MNGGEAAALAAGLVNDDCSVTEYVSDRLVRLPFYNELTPDDQMRVVGAITSFSQTKVA